MEDPKYAAALEKIKKLPAKTPEEYAKTYPNGVAGEGSTAAVGTTTAPGGYIIPQPTGEFCFRLLIPTPLPSSRKFS